VHNSATLSLRDYRTCAPGVCRRTAHAGRLRAHALPATPPLTTTLSMAQSTRYRRTAIHTHKAQRTFLHNMKHTRASVSTCATYPSSRASHRNVVHAMVVQAARTERRRNALTSFKLEKSSRLTHAPPSSEPSAWGPWKSSLASVAFDSRRRPRLSRLSPTCSATWVQTGRRPPPHAASP